MKKFFIYFSLTIFLVIGIYGVIYAAGLDRTYDGRKTDIYSLTKDMTKYDYENADGVTNIIVKKNLNETHALNSVTAVTFDFRGFDTLGESFILLTAISGSMVILRKGRRRENKDEQKHKS